MVPHLSWDTSCTKPPHFPYKTSKPRGNVETEQRHQLWASWFKFSSLVFWLSKIIKRRDFCAAYIATGRILDNAINITNIFSDQVGKDIMEYVVKSITEMKKIENGKEDKNY